LTAKADSSDGVHGVVADTAAGYAAAQAKIAQALTIVAAHIQTRADHLTTVDMVTGTSLIPAKDGEMPGGNTHKARAVKEVTQSVTTTIMDLVALTIATAPIGTDPVVVWEQAAAKATAYAE